VVVMAYFEGNDLNDSWQFKQARDAGETLYSINNADRQPWEYLVTFQMALWLRDSMTAQQHTSDCPYPVHDTNGTPLAFFGDFLSISTVDEPMLTESAIYAVTRDVILQTAEQTRAHDAIFVLAFIPHKAHVYWPLLDDATRAAMASQFSAAQLTEDGIRNASGISSEETIARLDANMDAQRDTLAALAEENNFLFLDFTPAMQDAASSGEMVYFISDTHWNQRGHDIAREQLRQFLREHHLVASE
ncbi:MAG: hypothetical protein D6737_18365, partial [Chloroflexi bacterium]